MVIVLEMGLITSPVGLNVFIIKGVAKDVPLRVIFVDIIPFLVASAMTIILMMIFPEGYTKWSRFFSNLYFAGASVVKKTAYRFKKALIWFFMLLLHFVSFGVIHTDSDERMVISAVEAL